MAHNAHSNHLPGVSVATSNDVARPRPLHLPPVVPRAQDLLPRPVRPDNNIPPIPLMNDKDMDMWMKRFNNEFTKEMNLRIKVFSGNEEQGLLFLNTLEKRGILNPAKARNLRDVLRGKTITPKHQYKINEQYAKLFDLEQKHDKMMKRKREWEENIKKAELFFKQFDVLKKKRDEFLRDVDAFDI
jgi:hypothetical protein